jgi:hypothetical protein
VNWQWAHRRVSLADQFLALLLAIVLLVLVVKRARSVAGITDVIREHIETCLDTEAAWRLLRKSAVTAGGSRLRLDPPASVRITG